MCGPTATQEQLSAEQVQFYQQMQQQDATVFSEDQAILQQMQSVYAPILAAGPNQYGFSNEETNDLNTSATEGVATDYASAAKALRENNAALGGGNTYLSSGVAAQQEAGLAQSAAQQESTDKLQIKEAGYQQGYNEFQEATNALEGTAGLLNPTAYSGAATSAGSAASTTANEIAQENESWYAPLVGAAASIGKEAINTWG